MMPAALQRLLDPGAATELFRQAGLSITAARADYLRHKPGETTIVSFAFQTAEDEIGRGYAHWCESPRRASEIMAKALTLRPRPSAVGVSTIRVDEHTVFYGFPNDARLRRLRWYATARKLSRSLADLAPAGTRLSSERCRVDVLRYKPERRIVVKARICTEVGCGRDVLVRYSTSRQAATMREVIRRLAAHGVHTPAQLARLDDDHVTVDEFVDGIEVGAAVREQSLSPIELASAISSFHRTPPPRLGTRSAVGDLAKARSGLAGLVARDSALATLVHTVEDRLIATLPHDSGPSVLLHGDLHDTNILVSRVGVSFIDLERVAVGPAEIDLGRLHGHAVALEVSQPGWSPGVVEHATETTDLYRSGVPGISDRALDWHGARAIVDQALLVARHVVPDWPELTRALLCAAVDTLRSPEAARQGRGP
jgi:aminoglycoside phosphotransferase (APT) family kinase protein